MKAWTPITRTLARLRLDSAKAFILVGLANTAFYIALAELLLALSADVMASHLAAQAVSLLASYLSQKRATFGIRGLHGHYALRFVAATIFLMMATSALVALARHVGVPGEVNFILAGFAYAGLSFVVHSAWTFHKG